MNEGGVHKKCPQKVKGFLGALSFWTVLFIKKTILTAVVEFS